jgi:hypothetical protein
VVLLLLIADGQSLLDSRLEVLAINQLLLLNYGLL